ncbi:MAG: hypothetical protein RR791_05470, partial [Lachnospiraceae bacterium]
FERTTSYEEKETLPNTIEMLLIAEKHENYNVDIEDTSITEGEYEDEMYYSYDKMREYLKDPILLINNLKKKRMENCR